MRGRSSSWGRRWRRLALASALGAGGAAAACAHPAPLAPGSEPEVRVGLGSGLASVTLGGDGELFVIDDGNGKAVGSIPAGTAWAVVPVPGGLVLVRPDGSRTEAHAGISAVNVTEGRFAMANGKRYRGRVNVVAVGATLSLQNRVPLESYLAGVIGLEMGPRKPEEAQALFAQAVVSRTFALRNHGRWEDEGYDVSSDTRDQVYGGVAAETPQVWDALHRTTGEVVTYHGNLIEAYFHAACGGRTAAVEEVFKGGQSEPYLRSVSDDRGGSRAYCESAPKFRWHEEWDGPALRAILTRTLPAVMNIGGDGLQPITDVEVTRTTKSGRVAELRIAFDRGEVRIQGPDVRSVLRTPAGALLNSAAFRVSVTKDHGVVSRLVADGQGSGHGIGLCQWGAIGRARDGQDYAHILATYFPGTKVERLY